MAWVIPVKRWIPRRSGALVRHNELQRSCSSPPPTSTAPTSVISHASPPSPFVSVSTTRNSAVAKGALSRESGALRAIWPVIRLGPDGVHASVRGADRATAGCIDLTAE